MTFDKEAGISSFVKGVGSKVTGFLGNKVAPMFASGLKPLAAGASPAAAAGNRAAATVFGGATRTAGGLQRGQLGQRAAARAAGTMAPIPPPQQNTAGHLAWNVARSSLGFGPAANATRTAKALGGAAGVGMIAAPLAAGAMSRGGEANNPYQKQLERQVTASDRGGVYTVKIALDADRVRAGVDLAGYGALAAPLITKLVAPKFYDQHQGLMHGADILGLGALTGTGLYGMATGKGRARTNDALDVGGLGLMGLALHRRLSDH